MTIRYGRLTIHTASKDYYEILVVKKLGSFENILITIDARDPSRLTCALSQRYRDAVSKTAAYPLRSRYEKDAYYPGYYVQGNDLTALLGMGYDELLALVTGESGSQGRKMSDDGRTLLRYHELGPSDQQKFAARNTEGDILRDANGDYLGFYPYYVFRYNQTANLWESDGGITIGFGHYISENEVTKGTDGFDQSEHDLLYTYVNQGTPLKGVPPNNGLSYRVPNSRHVPLGICKMIMDNDIQYHETTFNRVLDEYQYEMSVTEYDACIFSRFLCYRLGSEIDALLKAKNHDKTAWEKAINNLSMSEKRKEDAINLFCNGVYNPDSKGS